jgi:hypothetical protein
LLPDGGIHESNVGEDIKLNIGTLEIINAMQEVAYWDQFP